MENIPPIAVPPVPSNTAGTSSTPVNAVSTPDASVSSTSTSASIMPMANPNEATFTCFEKLPAELYTRIEGLKIYKPLFNIEADGEVLKTDWRERAAMRGFTTTAKRGVYRKTRAIASQYDRRYEARAGDHSQAPFELRFLSAATYPEFLAQIDLEERSIDEHENLKSKRGKSDSWYTFDVSWFLSFFDAFSKKLGVKILSQELELALS